ncbi:hypothetical protein J6524_23140 [Bradyrhizobium sp. WSM 1738]|uniref:hypothetical protein n=1 Tax=Bradyrhizobium hereditatis TaxID=2821405 RepID=UPI001CE31D50|nr:hypothetical protein [Bradyrhizobium hereditatis]MCA6117746.1 hypothetical protein [Bradyrhizobium hereditatis]
MSGDPIWLGCFVVLGASAFMVLRPVWFFGRKLSLEEALSVCWVTWSIYMGAFVIYIGLKLPLGLSRDAHAPAVGMAVCASLIAILWLARVTTDWRSAVTRSIFGLFILTLIVVPITASLALSRH